ncbi:MAG: uracil-DNA glycosylase [Gammaproteobacteria bacterium]
MSDNILPSTDSFSPNCVRCPRLAKFLVASRERYPEYYGRPVPAFGDYNSALLIVGLAPGMHGANATGRPFTGDHAGVLLYSTLYKFGFSNQSSSTSLLDGLKLIDCRITNAVRCVPPQNKPKSDEVSNCLEYLRFDLKQVRLGGVVVALGRVAHEAVLKACDLPSRSFKFGHGNLSSIKFNDLNLLSSYHCSRYNTQTRRLTVEMFEEVFENARNIVDRMPQ